MIRTEVSSKDRREVSNKIRMVASSEVRKKIRSKISVLDITYRTPEDECKWFFTAK